MTRDSFQTCGFCDAVEDPHDRRDLLKKPTTVRIRFPGRAYDKGFRHPLAELIAITD